MGRPVELAARLSNLSITEPNSGCWLWLGGLCGNQRYGRIRMRDGLKQAHRVSYEHHRGSILDGYEVDHLCRVTWCINPDHLEALTVEEHQSRLDHPLITICSRGHPFTGDNVYVSQSGKRACRLCIRERRRAVCEAV